MLGPIEVVDVDPIAGVELPTIREDSNLVCITRGAWP